MDKKIDVLSALDSAISRNIERGAAKGSPSDRDLRKARAAVANIIEATNALMVTLCINGDWEDGCYYYNCHSAPELQAAMENVDSAMSQIKG